MRKGNLKAIKINNPSIKYFKASEYGNTAICSNSEFATWSIVECDDGRREVYAFDVAEIKVTSGPFAGLVPSEME